MTTTKLIGLMLIVAFGVFMIIFGGYDDSPGAQGLGLLIVLGSIYGMVRTWRSPPK